MFRQIEHTCTVHTNYRRWIDFFNPGWPASVHKATRARIAWWLWKWYAMAFTVTISHPSRIPTKRIFVETQCSSLNDQFSAYLLVPSKNITYWWNKWNCTFKYNARKRFSLLLSMASCLSSFSLFICVFCVHTPSVSPRRVEMKLRGGAHCRL